METNIEIRDNQDRVLTITGDNATVDCGNDPNGARIFRVNYPYNLSRPLVNKPVYYNGATATVNGKSLSGNPIMVVEHSPYNVEIHIR